MNGKTLLGILLVLAGIAVLVFGGVSYTSSETIIDVGPVEVQAEEERSLADREDFAFYRTASDVHHGLGLALSRGGGARDHGGANVGGDSAP